MSLKSAISKKKSRNPATSGAIEDALKEPTVHYCINMPESLHIELKVRAARQKEDMKDIIIRSLREHMSL